PGPGGPPPPPAPQVEARRHRRCRAGRRGGRARPGQAAVTAPARPRGRRRRAEQAMVPDAEFTSYYGRPVIKEPVWQAPDVAGYLFFGGLAGASSVLAASAPLSGHRELGRAAQGSAAGASRLSA